MREKLISFKFSSTKNTLKHNGLLYSKVCHFVIPGTLPGMNDIIATARSNYFASAKQKKTFTARCRTSAIAVRSPQRTYKKVAIVIHWYEATMKRDFDNITAGAKFVLDGMVSAALLEDDNREIVKLLVHEVLLDRKRPRVEVTVYEQVTDPPKKEV
jgi:Holliday junction resolvase RusA-like endonuclease